VHGANADAISLVAVNTNIAAAGGPAAVMLLYRVIGKKPDLDMTLNGRNLCSRLVADNGLFTTGQAGQLIAQALGIVSVGMWCSVTGAVLFSGIKAFNGFVSRVLRRLRAWICTSMARWLIPEICLLIWIRQVLLHLRRELGAPRYLPPDIECAELETSCVQYAGSLFVMRS
jgi:hypothetical protein